MPGLKFPIAPEVFCGNSIHSSWDSLQWWWQWTEPDLGNTGSPNHSLHPSPRPMLVGNLFAILFSGLVTTLVSYMEYKNDPTNARFTWDHIKTQFAAIKSPKGPSPILRKSPIHRMYSYR